MYHAIPDDVEINFSINLSLSWLNAKLLSSAIDCTTIEKTNKMSTLFIYRLAYLLYFPVFLFGPIFHFTDFHNSLSKLQNGSSTINQTTYLLSIGRYIFWAYFLENFLKYYVYSSALLNYPNILLQLDQWSIAGFGFSLMLTFYIKYLILYGISGSISRLDGFDQHMIAEAPRCIAHMSKTSYLWRKFDQGLYRFLVKYFYRPITGDTGNHRNPIRRFMASAVCFGIIAVWHEQAESFSIIIWVIVNFLLLNFETLCSIIRKQSFLKNIESSNNFVRSIMSRLEAIIGSPYLAAAYLSNILFLSNYESTWIIIQKLFFDPYSISLLFAVLYAGCHVCNYLNNEECSSTTKQRKQFQ